MHHRSLNASDTFGNSSPADALLFFACTVCTTGAMFGIATVTIVMSDAPASFVDSMNEELDNPSFWSISQLILGLLFVAVGAILFICTWLLCALSAGLTGFAAGHALAPVVQDGARCISDATKSVSPSNVFRFFSLTKDAKYSPVNEERHLNEDFIDEEKAVRIELD